MKRICALILAALVTSIGLIGCDSNPTNEPSQADIDKAVENKFKKIDEDPTLTPQQKEEMKKHMSGGSPRTRDGAPQ